MVFELRQKPPIDADWNPSSNTSNNVNHPSTEVTSEPNNEEPD